jgi:myo-inositol-1(or 4)-monophosphatase
MPSYLETSVEIAREAGAVLMARFDRRIAIESKGEYDLVTEADRDSERLVVERLTAEFPSHRASAGTLIRSMALRISRTGFHALT